MKAQMEQINNTQDQMANIRYRNCKGWTNMLNESIWSTKYDICNNKIQKAFVKLINRLDTDKETNNNPADRSTKITRAEIEQKKKSGGEKYTQRGVGRVFKSFYKMRQELRWYQVQKKKLQENKTIDYPS